MTYRQKKKRKKIGKCCPVGYFKEREIREIKKRNKGEVSASEIIRLGVRRTYGYPKKTHRVNQRVVYKGKNYVVVGRSRKGVHLAEFQSKDGLIDNPKLKKPIFVPEKKYSGNARPIEEEFVFAPA